MLLRLVPWSLATFVVGEVTGGGAHPAEPYALDGSLYVIVPWGRSISAITHSNWEGTGVQPDVASPAGVALERALKALEDRERQRTK